MTDKPTATYHGGPAFPLHNHGAQTLGLHFTGMTLRDYFAAKAMAALIVAHGPAPQGGWPTYAERTAYTIADAMLKARDGH
jgi:hypothetical protein